MLKVGKHRCREHVLSLLVGYCVCHFFGRDRSSETVVGYKLDVLVHLTGSTVEARVNPELKNINPCKDTIAMRPALKSSMFKIFKGSIYRSNFFVTTRTCLSHTANLLKSKLWLSAIESIRIYGSNGGKNGSFSGALLINGLNVIACASGFTNSVGYSSFILKLIP